MQKSLRAFLFSHLYFINLILSAQEGKKSFIYKQCPYETRRDNNKRGPTTTTIILNRIILKNSQLFKIPHIDGRLTELGRTLFTTLNWTCSAAV